MGALAAAVLEGQAHRGLPVPAAVETLAAAVTNLDLKSRHAGNV